MKKIYLLLLLILISSGANSQTFTDKDLQKEVLKINTSKTASNYEALYKRFSTSTVSEIIPLRYYAAVSQYLKTESLIGKSSNESLLESNALAFKDAMSILNSQPDNIEVTTLIGLISLQKIVLKASFNVQKDKNQIAQYISKAESSSPNNPRLTLLKAGFKKQFPEENFNNMSSAQLYQKAEKDFAATNSTDISAPNWGRQIVSVTL